MYAGDQDRAIANLRGINDNLAMINKNRTVNNNVQQYQKALSGGQDEYLQQMKDSGNEDAYNNMYMRKMQLENQQPLTMVDRLRGMFGGN